MTVSYVDVYFTFVFRLSLMFSIVSELMKFEKKLLLL